MTRIRMLIAGCLVLVGAFGAIASDRTAVYTRIDKVVLEPGPDAPVAIQIWGVFSFAKPDDVSEYLPPARGYLYFKLDRNPDAARKEWSDLGRVAGTGQIVSMGNRFELRPRLRKAGDRRERPDPYIVSAGLTKVRPTTDYEPIRLLAAYKD